MSDTSDASASNPNLPADTSAQANSEAETLLRSLRRKEGSWVDWAQACQTLQKSGYSPQAIFEGTGFEPIQQNQIIVAAQVYSSIVSAGVSEAVKQHFGQRGSDALYELRILNQQERAATAELLLDKNLDMDEAHEVAKAVREVGRLSKRPEEFTEHPGDAIAYQTWRLARQKSDLQERSRLIARGLRFAHSPTARKKIEQLLTDFTVTPSAAAPILPLYRLDSEEQLPRVLPVVGKLPLTKADFQAVPVLEPIDPFGMVQFSGTGAWVPVPGWQVVLAAEDPVGILCGSDALPTPVPNASEDMLVVVDRADREWNAHRYFIVEQDNQLHIRWFEQAPELPILGQVIVIVRPKKVLDENYTRELWQIDE